MFLKETIKDLDKKIRFDTDFDQWDSVQEVIEKMFELINEMASLVQNHIENSELHKE